ncbi:DNA polymerase III delta prime subunit [hydrothermal vent metagenome]|uniref:DNA polymerase III delta prime subunit n=1 Tax=hydrothermal vent metagenome TaxID=652676 RepID=A0A3B0WLH4_9ZZZZ
MKSLYPWFETQWQQWCQLGQSQGHAYLLSAPKGIGIEQFVTAVVQKTVCQTPTEQGGCGQCQSCHLLQSQQHPDFYHLTRLEDKKEISVEQIRTLIQKLNETSHQGGYKIIWIEGTEQLNQSAFNALLKNLEEPARQTLFLLTTHNIGRLPETIKSRCQQLNFPPPVLKDAIAWLQQTAPQMDLALIKRALRVNWGAPLDALNWMETGKFEEDTQWKEGLKQLQTGRKTVSNVVAEWLKWSTPISVFDYFYLWSVSAVRSVTYVSQNSTQNSTQNIAQTFSQSTNPEQHQQLQNWLTFQQATLQAKQHWLSNANKELVLETLCLEWLEVQQNPAPFQSVFQSKLQKGALA